MPDTDVDDGDSIGMLDLGTVPDFETDEGDLEDATVEPGELTSQSSAPEWHDPFDQDEDEDETPAPAPAQQQTTAARKGLALNQSTREGKLAAIKEADPEALLNYAEGLRAATTKAQTEAAELRRQTERDRTDYETRFAQLEAKLASPLQPTDEEEPDPTDIMRWQTWFQAQTGTAPTTVDLLHAKARYKQAAKLQAAEAQLKQEQEQRTQFQQARDAEVLRTTWGKIVRETPVLATASDEERNVAAQAVASFMAEHNMPVTEEAVQQAFGAVMWPAFNAQMVAQQAASQQTQTSRAAAAATPPPGGPARSATGTVPRPKDGMSIDDIAAMQKRRTRQR